MEVPAMAPFWKRHHIMKSIPLSAFLLFAFAAGCGTDEEPIRKYKMEIIGGQAPKTEAASTRYLAAIIPLDNGQSWFFKLPGEPAKLEPHAKDFRAFMESIAFPKAGGKPIAWKLPAGWIEEPGSGIRFATLKLPSEPNPLEMSVSLLGGELGANINRWRGELGLKSLNAIGDQEFNENVGTIKTDGRNAYLMDMTGKRDPAAAMPMMPNAK